MSEAVHAHPVNLKVICREALTVRSDLYLVFNLEDRIIRRTRPRGIWQPRCVTVSAAGTIAKNTRSQTRQLIRVSPNLGESLDLRCGNSFGYIGVLSLQSCCGLLSHGNDGAYLTGFEYYVDTLNSFSIDSDFVEDFPLVPGLFHSQLVFSGAQA